MIHSSILHTAAFVATYLIAFLAVPVRSDLLSPLPDTATSGALKWQPVLDFDKDSCYHVAAIDKDKNLNPGLEPRNNNLDLCRAQDRLYHSNAYSRQRCNHGWCAYMYGYYFEMDQMFAFGQNGHRHDWEFIIVWTLNDEVRFVSWSAHGDYTTAYYTGVRFEGNHPKLVYHHGAANTGSFRLAKPEDDKIENHWGVWFKAWLVSREVVRDDIGHALMVHDWGNAHSDMKDERFGGSLNEAMPQDARNNGFDPWA
ncbi:NPP1-domain-containing protein [Eremomyces bilateralis CBS 781.70]|uniref:NPP1-domain-containing protein n=1 Tax=Eremomyces bilateralis CBS 781.70 TaxID=1392243 RepID=A0A6G1G7T1_9PEZI|nr:NPP1-domain-containing protein [Eremomyces bilateralis CBS 781.70]KAF1813981.1 NPP1-domain-containing protein [Eremomyces bilateralis CBS 781.70]